MRSGLPSRFCPNSSSSVTSRQKMREPLRHSWFESAAANHATRRPVRSPPSLWATRFSSPSWLVSSSNEGRPRSSRPSSTMPCGLAIKRKICRLRARSSCSRSPKPRSLSRFFATPWGAPERALRGRAHLDPCRFAPRKSGALRRAGGRRQVDFFHHRVAHAVLSELDESRRRLCK